MSVMASGGVVSDKGIEVMSVDLTEELLCETIIVSFPYLVEGEQKRRNMGEGKVLHENAATPPNERVLHSVMMGILPHCWKNTYTLSHNNLKHI